MNYKVTEVVSAGNVQTQYGVKVKSTVHLEGWEGEVDYWGQTFVGDIIEGTIAPAKDPKYNPTLKKTPAPRSNSVHSAPQSAKNEAVFEAMGRKEMSVNSAMDRKEQSIQHTASVRDATLLVCAMIETKLWANVSEEMYKNKVREYTIFYKNLYSNPDLVNPAASEEPPF